MNKKQNIIPTNAEGQFHGLCIGYWSNGNVMLKQRCVNGIQHGIYESYSSDRELWRKSYNSNNKTLYSEYYFCTNIIQFNI